LHSVHVPQPSIKHHHSMELKQNAYLAYFENQTTKEPINGTRYFRCMLPRGTPCHAMACHNAPR
jgi:hypothetical protein